MDNEYRYTVGGLGNVVLEGIEKCTDDHGEECVTIPRINELHNVIATCILKRQFGMTGAELKFLRTLMGMTQAELGKVVNREAQTIGRWERSEFQDDPNAEAILRLVAGGTLAVGTRSAYRDCGWLVYPNGS